jgi:hypothetical protein
MRNPDRRRGVFAIAAATLAAVAPFSAPPVSARNPGAWTPPVYLRQDSLFLAAATGEPRFELLRDSCEKKLVSEDTATLRYLLAQRLTAQTPRQRHYVQRLFTQISDSGRNAGPSRLLTAALADAPDSLRPQLLHIGSKLGDSAFRLAALPFLASKDPDTRRMAARCLGTYPHPDNAALLWKGLEKTSGLERHQRLWSLGAQGKVREWKRLFPLLGDPHQFNRRQARDLLLAAADSSWDRLRRALPARHDNDAFKAWGLLAFESRGSDAFLAEALRRLPGEEARRLRAFRRIQAKPVVK